jgi:hypothetical protein
MVYEFRDRAELDEYFRTDPYCDQRHLPAHRDLRLDALASTGKEDDGGCIAESVAICRYLEGQHPEPDLMGCNPREQAEIEMWNRRMELELFGSIGQTVRNTHPMFRAVPRG